MHIHRVNNISHTNTLMNQDNSYQEKHRLSAQLFHLKLLLKPSTKCIGPHFKDMTQTHLYDTIKTS